MDDLRRPTDARAGGRGHRRSFILAHLLEPREVLIGIEDDKPEAIAAMTVACAGTGYQVRPVPTRYPSGGVKQLVHLLTGKGSRSTAFEPILASSVSTSPPPGPPFTGPSNFGSRCCPASTVTGRVAQPGTSMPCWAPRSRRWSPNAAVIGMGRAADHGRADDGLRLAQRRGAGDQGRNCILAAGIGELTPEQPPMPLHPLRGLRRSMPGQPPARNSCTGMPAPRSSTRRRIITCSVASMRLLQHRLPQPHPIGAVLPLRQERNLGAGERETKAELARQRHQARLERLEREQKEREPNCARKRHLGPCGGKTTEVDQLPIEAAVARASRSRAPRRWTSHSHRLRSPPMVPSGTVERRCVSRPTSPHILRNRRRSGDAPGVVCDGAWHRGAGLVFGWGVLVNLAMATVVALAAETLMLAARGKPLALHLGDCSAVVTAWLLAAALPSLAPWWLTALGVAFAIVVAKHLYGGRLQPLQSGHDRLCGAADLVSTQMSTWPIPTGLGRRTYWACRKRWRLCSVARDASSRTD